MWWQDRKRGLFGREVLLDHHASIGTRRRQAGLQEAGETGLGGFCGTSLNITVIRVLLEKTHGAI